MPLVGIGTLPTPFSPASVPLPPETGGRGHTSLGVGGWGESQFRRGAYTVVLFKCTHFVIVCYSIYICLLMLKNRFWSMCESVSYALPIVCLWKINVIIIIINLFTVCFHLFVEEETGNSWMMIQVGELLANQSSAF
jgi:hypothetical protein